MSVSYEPAESSTAAWAVALADAVSTATGEPAFQVDEFPAVLPYSYNEVHLSHRYTDSPVRVGGMREDVGFRLSLRTVSKSIYNARLMQDRIARRFRGPVLLGGRETWVRFESGDTFDRDDEDYFHSLTDWVFVR